MNTNIDQLPYSSKLLSSISGILHAFSLKTSTKPQDLYCTHQVHGKNILEVHSQSILEAENTQADGLFTINEQLLLGVKTADCLPVLMADKKAKAVAAIHAGWRGLHAGILIEALKFFDQKNISRKEICIAIGPAIQSCCFEVSQETEKLFIESWGHLLTRGDSFSSFRKFSNNPRQAQPTSANSAWLDMPKVAKLQLTKQGLLIDNIDDLSICTYCTNTPLASYRRGTNSQRQWSWIQRR